MIREPDRVMVVGRLSKRIHAQDPAVPKRVAPPHSCVELHTTGAATRADSSSGKERILELTGTVELGTELRPVGENVAEPAANTVVPVVDGASDRGEYRVKLDAAIAEAEDGLYVARIECRDPAAPKIDVYLRHGDREYREGAAPVPGIDNGQ